MKRKWEDVSALAVVQATFWITLFSFVWYISAQTLGIRDAPARAVLIFGCHLLNFYACYGFIIPRYYERKRYAATLIGMLLLLAVLTPVRLFIERHFVSIGPYSRNKGMVLF